MAQSSSSSGSQQHHARTRDRIVVRRTLNVPLLVGSLVALAVFAVAAFFWHSYQVDRTAGAFLDRAATLKEEEKWSEAAGYIHRYLRLRPDDVDAWIQQAETFDKGTPPNASGAWAASPNYFRAVGVADARMKDLEALDGSLSEEEKGELASLQDKVPQLRRRLTELLLESGQYKSAHDVAAELLGEEGAENDPEASRLLALSLFRRVQAGSLLRASESEMSIAEAFEKALALKENSGDIELSLILAQVYRSRENLELLVGEHRTKTADERDAMADAVINAMVQEAERSGSDETKAKAYLARHSYLTRNRLDEASYRTKHGLAEGVTDLATALQIDGDNPLVLAEAARVAIRERRYGDAITHYEAIIASDGASPAGEAAHAALGQVHLQDPKLALQLTQRLARPFGEQFLQSLADQVAQLEDVDGLAERIVEQLSTQVADQLAKRFAEPQDEPLAIDPQLAERLAADPQLPEQLARLMAPPLARQIGKQLATDRQAAEQLTIRLPVILQLVQPHVQKLALQQAIETWQAGVADKHEESVELNQLLAMTLIAADRPNEAKRADPSEAERPLDILDRIYANPRVPRSNRLQWQSTRDLLVAKWHLARKEITPAVPLLESVASASETTTSANSRREAATLLGRAFTVLRQWGRAAAAYEKAGSLDPNTTQEWLLAAAAWTKVGRAEDAANCYEEVLKRFDQSQLPTTADLWFSLAMARLQIQEALPLENRDFSALDKALAEIESTDRSRPLANPWQLTLLRANCELAKRVATDQAAGANEDILESLRAAEKQYPDSRDLCQRLVTGYERLGASDDADRVMDTLNQLVSQVEEENQRAALSAGACVLQAELYMQRRLPKDAVKELEEGIQRLPESVRPDLKDALVRAHLRLGAEGTQNAYKILCEMQAERPQDVNVVRQLAEIAIETRQVSPVGDQPISEAEKWENRLKELEGSEGTDWRLFRARRLLAMTEDEKDTADPQLDEAATLLTQIERLRPEWAKPRAVHGQLLARRGRVDEAIAAYENAIRLGDTQADEPLIRLLYDNGQFEKAKQYLAKLRARAPFSPALAALDREIAVKVGDLDRAIEMLRREIAAMPNDPQTVTQQAQMRFRLGQLLMADKQFDEAESEFVEAVRLVPADIAAYDALFRCNVAAGKSDEAREKLVEISAILEDLVANGTVSKFAQAFQMGRYSAQLGDTEKAAEWYEVAIGMDDVKDEEQLPQANLKLKNPDREIAFEGQEVFRTALEKDPKNDDIRFTLAESLILRGGEKGWREAKQLLDQAHTEDASEDSRRAQIRLLLTRGGKECLSEARQRLETLVAESTTTQDGDLVSLAALYECEANLRAAQEKYTSLISRDETGREPYIRLYASFLLRQARGIDRDDGENKWRRDDYLDGALQQIIKLEKLLGEKETLSSNSLDALRLRVEWQHETGADSTIAPLVEKFAADAADELQADPRREAMLAQTLGNLCAQVEQHEEAERWYRRLVELTPENYGPRAVHMAQQGRVEEAVQMCLDATTPETSVRSSILLASVLMAANNPTDKTFAMAEPIVQKALAEAPDDGGLREAVAQIRIVQGKTDEAIKIYKEFLNESETNDAARSRALNNLATLQAEIPGQEADALDNINKAIDIEGALPPLLDTKGMILFFLGRSAEAVDLLEQAAYMPDADPRFSFHLAVAYGQTDRTDEARQLLQEARKRKFEEMVLTAKDQELLKVLEEKLR